MPVDEAKVEEIAREIGRKIDEAAMRVLCPKPPEPTTLDLRKPCPDCQRWGAILVGCPKHMVC